MDYIEEDNAQNELDLKTSLVQEMQLNAFQSERTIYIWESINDNTAFITNRMIEKLCIPDINGIKQPITIKISSTGGEVFSALSIVSAIERAQEKGYEVITMAYACCMSAAVNLLSAGTKRYGQRYTRFMIHDVGSYNFGFQSKEDIKNNYEEHEAIWKLLSELLMKKSKLTKEKLDDIVKHKKEFYFWPEEALELGLIDKII
jgi:ATP-dependent protease ClpP protease subunit